ncbi:MAG TPA: STAS domain-containing protein [Solirubrobacteraceae bacterium]|jgi:anti-anti-sigma factor|nr:STAS domain-containing protein [Solirubrobacteraceae bacterium]
MTQTGQLQIAHDQDGSRERLALSGELDVVTAPALDASVERLLSGRVESLILDLRGVTFIDSSGLRTVLTAWDSCREAGREFLLIPGDGACLRLFRITGVLDDLPIWEPESGDGFAQLDLA